MAYPFLPVNPSCGTVVVNDVCGCSSVVTNSGCNSNNPCSTTITASSTIVYNGPPVLSCIIAEPCDTLNVILQKIDEIICNLLSQINILNIQVNNITNQIININNEIVDINNTLDGCCTIVTTTSTSTTKFPCEGFNLYNNSLDPVAIIITDCITGLQEAVIIPPGVTPICVETDSPLTLPGSIIAEPTGYCPVTTSTTTTSIPTTTTTTTLEIFCECITFTNTDSIEHNIEYTDCTLNIIQSIILPGEVINICGSLGSTDSLLVTISIGATCVAGTCPCLLSGNASELENTTTTTTTRPPTTTSTTTRPPTTTTTTTHAITTTTTTVVPTTTSTTTTHAPTTTTTTTIVCLNCVPHDVTIGTQVWAGCNLNVTTYNDGTPIPEVSDLTAWAALTTGAWCSYDNNPANDAIYGKLYNWYAVKDARGLAPVGYHIPTDANINTLNTFLGGASVAGGKLKQPGLCHWIAPNVTSINSGFNALAAGQRHTLYDYFDQTYSALFWGYTDPFVDSAVRLSLSTNDTNSNVAYANKKFGFSVRCIKN